MSDPLDLIRAGLARSRPRIARAGARPRDAIGCSSCGGRRSGSTPRSCGRSATGTRSAACADDTRSARCRGSPGRRPCPRSCGAKLLKTARLARDHQPHTARRSPPARSPWRTSRCSRRSPTDATTCTPSTRRPCSKPPKTVEVLDFPAVTRRWALLADDVLARDDAAFAFERRGITLSPTTHGSVVSGFLDPEAAATVDRALDALATARRAGRHPHRVRSATPTRSC